MARVMLADLSETELDHRTPHDGSGHVCGAINNSGHRNQLGSAEDLIKQVCHCAAQYQIAVMQVAASQFADVFRHRDRLHMRPELVW
ncbi:hypothetical protein [Ruegeria faecimaris]|uniref:hypothetical protein n=2 Tax=Ruegeria faecimaris TaxID=686389 RepID=UPI00115BBA62|nr:hypothetical protein [Ruegeria faecimaris]